MLTVVGFATALLLAQGTQAVAGGDLSPRPIVSTNDELGTLTQSFNTMTRQLADARTAVEKNRAELENAKAHLESVLANMSAGVMVPPLKRPMWENLSRLARVMVLVCMPPIERPAIARLGWSDLVRKLAST